MFNIDLLTTVHAIVSIEGQGNVNLVFAYIYSTPVINVVERRYTYLKRKM